MLYHVSPTSGLKTLEPHVSTHKKAYVYAIKNIVTGMLFGVRHDDFDLLISTNEDGVPTVYECYPDAFRRVYEGMGCSVYVLPDDGFLQGMTSWMPELVSEHAVDVVEEIVVDDLYQRLLLEEQKGTLKIVRYNASDDYRKLIVAHVVDRLIRFKVDLDTCMETDQRFATYYRGIIQTLLGAMDGHLLP